MEMNYKSNSHKSKERKKEEETKSKNIEKVVSGKAKTKKKSGMTKMAEAFISEDVDDVKSYIFMDVLIPAMKKAVSDVVTNGIDMLLYGETNVSSKKRPGQKVQYNRYSDRERRSSDRTAKYDYDDVILDSRDDAEEVIMQMNDILDDYDAVSVSDYYELVGVAPKFTDNKYGWTNLNSAKVIRISEGYMIKLPKARPLD